MSLNIKKEHFNLLEKAQSAKVRAANEAINRIIKEEFTAMIEEAKKKAGEIEKKLEELRGALIKEGKLTLSERGSARNDKSSLPERRIPIQTVSEIVDVPINELLLFFLNGHRITEGRRMFEYRLGMVYFYGMPKAFKEVE